MKKENLNRGIWMAEGHTLRPLISLAINQKDGTVLVRIPGGQYEIGDGKGNYSPQHEVELSEYWLGVYCVSNRQYGKFVRETGHRVPDKADWGTPVWKNGKCPGEKLDHPVVCVSWDDAVAYGKWVGLDLPSEAQWEVGARGPGGLIYPWGNEWDEKKCLNDNMPGSDEETGSVWGYGEGVSGWGTYQQSGNVGEWCGDWYEKWYGEKYYRDGAKNPRGPATGSDRVFRGAPDFRGANRNMRDPGDRYDYLGFRLATNGTGSPYLPQKTK